MSAGRFSEGLAGVQVERKWGFIDRAGKFVIKASYDCVQPFSEGLAVIGIREEGRWRFGYIDKTGAIVVPAQFSTAHSFSNNLALVRVGMTDDEMALKAMEDYEAGKAKNEIEKEVEMNKMNYGYIDKSGKFIWKPPDSK
jgi:WG containing repeat